MTTNQVYQRTIEEHDSPLSPGAPRALCRRVCNRTNPHGQILKRVTTQGNAASPGLWSSTAAAE